MCIVKFVLYITFLASDTKGCVKQLCLYLNVLFLALFLGKFTTLHVLEHAVLVGTCRRVVPPETKMTSPSGQNPAVFYQPYHVNVYTALVSKSKSILF